MGENNNFHFSQHSNKVYDINGKMYVIDKETGKIAAIVAKDDPIHPEDLNDVIKLLAKNQKECLIFMANEKEKIAEELNNINQTLNNILGAMKKTENPFVKTLTTVGIGVGVLGIIQIIDTILKWFGG